MTIHNLVKIALLAFLPTCASLNKARDVKLLSSKLEHCYGPDIQSIQIPIFPDKEKSHAFTYRYKFSQKGDTSKPVIIFLPGGPGYPSMDESQSSGLPNGFRYILTDQRGTGCNAQNESILPLEAITSHAMAKDVIAMIRHLKLDHYMIYGHSFGTVHATKVVASIEEDFRRSKRSSDNFNAPVNPPKALVLEGTLGKAFTKGNGLQASIDEWEKVRAKLPKETMEQLSHKTLPFSELIPEGLASLHWGTYINGMLNLGQFPPINGFGDLSTSLMALQPEQVNTPARKALSQHVASSQYMGYFNVFLQVDCTDLYDSFRGEISLQHGKLVVGGPDLCAEYRKTNKFFPYDSADYYLSTPIYYFQGEADPATPVWQAQHHFKSHGAADRKYIQLKGGGHTPLQRSLFHCKDALWSAILTGDDSLIKILKQCAGVKSVDKKIIEANAVEFYLTWNWQP